MENHNSVVNLMCLILKHELYVMRCMGRNPSFAAIIAKVNKIKTYEWYNAEKNNNTRFHNKKWGCIKDQDNLEQ